MAQNSASSSKAALLLATTLGALTLSGCDVPPEATKFFNEKIGPMLGMKIQVDPKQAKDVSTAAPAKAETKDIDFRVINAEFIKEMYRVVLLREVRSQEEFGRAMNQLDQGGHYEAIYNGVIYAEEFRGKEKGVAPVPALKAFSEIMAQITLDQKYDPLKIAAPGSEAADSGVAPPQPTDQDRQNVKDDIEREAITKSTFWMKRRLGEEVLKTIDLKKEYREKMASWYGHFTVALNKRGVDFGIAERNRPDEYFHYKWALDAEEDRLKWECLNRVQRVINAGAGLREPTPPPPPTAASGDSAAAAPDQAK